MRGEDGASKVLRQLNPVAGVDHKTLFTLLANNGADMNICFPEDSFPDEKNYKCSIIINIVRRNSIPMDQLRANLLCLFEYGANLKTVDSRGRDVLMHSIMQNHNELVQFFINNADRGLLKNHKDHEGKNAIFYVVNPVPFGSFENVEILNKILKTGFGYELAATDKYGKTPLDYAKLQKSGVLSSVISQKIGLDSNITNSSSEPTYIPSSHWPQQRFDFDRDSQQLLEQAEAKRVKELMEEQKDSYVPIEKAYQSKQYSVYFEGQGVDRRPYDAYMTKVDLKNGYYGDYTFYKMQIVYDSNRGLYLVITRYGRIGEQGMSQQSPFHNPEDATKEFKTIFKQKSANEWDTAHTAFIKHPKKYVLVNVSYTNIKHQDYLAPFDYDNCAKTQIEKAIRLLLEEISNVTMYQRSLQQMGIDQSQLPVSNIKKETILQATKVLNHLGDTFKELTRLRQMDRADFNYEKSHEIYQSLSDLTSQFYQLIPMKETDFWSVRPIQNEHQIKELRDKLDTLTNIEFSSRILLGALFKQMVVNPVDYVYDCIQTNFRQLQTEEPEFSLIHQYITNTCDDNMKKVKFTIFKIQRRGEGERYEKFQSLENRRLLFHGSAMTNMLGILSQGIRIAPPEAPTTGYMFGKGAYFADLFKKSANYSHSGHKTRLMLICEVALGKMMERYTDWMELKLPANYNSVKAIGYLGGNFKDKAIVTPEGYQVPFGAEIQSEKPTEAQFMKTIRQNPEDKRTYSQYSYRNWQSQEPTFNWPLQANEYIVYNVDQVKMRYMIQWEQN